MKINTLLFSILVDNKIEGTLQWLKDYGSKKILKNQNFPKHLLKKFAEKNPRKNSTKKISEKICKRIGKKSQKNC